MNKWRLVLVTLIVCFIAVSSSDFRAQQGNVLSPSVNDGRNQANVKIEKDYGKMPLYFIPNKGQMDKKVYYYIQGKDKTVYFTSEGITYSLDSKDSSQPSQPSRRWVVKLEFVNAGKNVKPESLEQSGTKVSYLQGKPEQWHAGLQAAAKIIYRELWRGIDLVYYGTVNKMKYEFIVHPGADPSQIKLAYRGAESVKENSQGQLEVQTPMGGFLDDTPEAWQEIAGKRETVSLKYAVESGKSEKRGKETDDAPAVTYGFTIGKYDPKQTLILDPAVLVYCGYIGGSGEVVDYGIAVDASGCAYVTGCSSSNETAFPVTVGPDLTYNGGNYDAFVAKVKADGTGLDYCGFIGGSSVDSGVGIAVDGDGCAYISGITSSTESTFPVTVGPDLTYNGGDYDVFVAKVMTDGSGLDYCGYIGGANMDMAEGITLDASGCVYVTGRTESDQTTFPVTVGPDLTHKGGQDAFVAKVNAAGNGLAYCGYIGGPGFDEAWEITVDASGCAYVIGNTDSDQTTFPVAGGPDLTYNGGSYDAFVAKVKANGTGLVYCGYIGGASFEKGMGIAVDASGNAYVMGYTDSDQTTFPVFVGPYLTYSGCDYDAFVAKVKVDGTAFDYCGYIGGSDFDFGYGIAVDALGCAYVTGSTLSKEATFPVIDGPDLTHNGGYDIYVAKVNASGTALDYCGYIGGSGGEVAYAIAVDGSGSAYVTGYSGSTETTFPVTVGPDLSYNGAYDAFVAKISGNSIYTVNFAAGNGGSLTGTTSQTVMQGNNCTPVEAVPNSGYNFVNWTGTNGFVTAADNPLTVANVNADMMITANFAHSNPAGWVPLDEFQNNMIVYGKAYTGNNPATEGDWLGAFGPGDTSDCRGIAAVQANGNYYITIGSNEISGEIITFKLWPLPSGPAIDGGESVNFIADDVYSGLPLHFGPRGQNLALVNGWNWISFNTLPDDTSFNSVFGTPGVIEQIKSQNQAAIYTGGNWIGDLTDMGGIANGIMYKVKTNQAYAFNVTGLTVPYNTPLSLITGWNWTAYLPTLSQPVADAVNSIITPVSQVKSQTQSVIKIGSTLFGDLTQMEPNKGYTILMNQPGVLQYPQGVSVFPDQARDKATAVKTQAVSWPVIKGNQYNMVAVGKVYLEGQVINTNGYYLAGIGPNGEKDGRSLSPVKTDGSYFATILGNTGGETIKFKLINSTTGKTYDTAGSMQFQPDNLKTGFDLKARSVNVTAPALGANIKMGAACTISWDSFEIDNVKIELYKGGKSFAVIAPSLPAASHTYSWTIPDRMPTGSDYQVKVTCIDQGVIAKDLSKTFSIKPAASIALISPNGGEIWKVKKSVDITWRSGGIDNIKIELYKGTLLKTVVSASTPAATGKYTWTIPANHPQGTKFKIKISSVDAGLNLSDAGDSYFSIGAGN
ncbi:MAG: SBBP repeat-containing protein [Candidatus Aminicenantes bacterium]|nr:SBBP repeat-containing protein [Candidatus Aminicenantes bacterium]